MLNKEIPKKDLDKIKLVVFDSDGVSVPRGTDINETITSDFIRVDAKTTFITPGFADNLAKLRDRYTVAISSGRALLYLRSMYAGILGKGTILQAENGNVSLIEGTIVQHFSYDEQYFETIDTIKREVQKLPIEGVEPKQFILSVHAENELKEVYGIVKKYDKRNELRVMWNGEAFDIMRGEISKAAGLGKLIEHLGITKEQTIAMGDRVNDIELMEAAGIAVSADKDAVPAEYWTEGNHLPGEILAQYLVDHL